VTSLGFKDQIARDDLPDWVPWPYGKLRRHIQLAAHDLLAKIADGVLNAVVDRAGDRIVFFCAEFCTDDGLEAFYNNFNYLNGVVCTMCAT
jgi:hypothetical protein